jgi:hypothetical protein
MNSKVWKLLVALTAVVAVLALGCSDNNSTTPTPEGPGAPTLSTPADGAANVAINPTVFRWTTGAGATGYRLQVATESQFVNPTNYDAATDTTYSASGLSYGMTYHWRVESRDAAGLTSFSGARSFVTIGAIMDTWDALAQWRDTLVVDQFRYTFSDVAGDSLFELFYTTGSTNYTHSGGFTASATQITFHETNNDGTPVDSTYSRAFSLPSPYTALTLEYREGSSVWDFEYNRAP